MHWPGGTIDKVIIIRVGQPCYLSSVVSTSHPTQRAKLSNQVWSSLIILEGDRSGFEPFTFHQFFLLFAPTTFRDHVRLFCYVMDLRNLIHFLFALSIEFVQIGSNLVVSEKCPKPRWTRTTDLPLMYRGALPLSYRRGTRNSLACLTRTLFRHMFYHDSYCQFRAELGGDDASFTFTLCSQHSARSNLGHQYG